MKALLLQKKNQPWSIQEVADPLLRNGRVAIRVWAAAFNHRDLWITKGMYAGIKYPIILGSDGSGIIEEVGGDLDRGLLGQEVILNPGHLWGNNEAVQAKDFEVFGLPRNGTFAELVTIPVKYVHPKPKHLTFEQAAALPLAGVTAFRALFARAKAQSTDKVLISGIGGGVALFALQFALAKGCEVWVTSGSEKKIKGAKAIGAKGGVNYRSKDWHKTLKEKAGGFDVIIDGAGGPGFSQLIDVAAPGGRIALYGGTTGNYESLSPQKIFWKQLSILGSTMGSENDFYNMLTFVNKHKIVPVIDEVFPFDEAVAAAEKMDRGEQFGKVVLRM